MCVKGRSPARVKIAKKIIHYDLFERGFIMLVSFRYQCWGIIAF